MTSITPYKADQFALLTPEGQRAAQAIQASLAPGETIDVFDLPCIRIPAGGGKNWDLPDGTSAPVIEGIILLRQPVRAYWASSFDESGGGSPPDCSSPDGITGLGDPGGRCAACPMAEFGSGKDTTQACRLITRLFILRPAGILPTLISLPPTSYKAAKNYVLSTIANHGAPYWAAITRIGLFQAKSAGGISYSQATLTVGEILTGSQAAAVAQVRADLMPTLQEMPVAASEGV